MIVGIIRAECSAVRVAICSHFGRDVIYFLEDVIALELEEDVVFTVRPSWWLHVSLYNS